jgi:ribosome recycling factor
MDASEISLILDIAEESMDGAIDHLQHELLRIRTGKASGDLISNVLVPYYGTPTPISQIANISTADARTILIQPWEKNMLSAIEKGIFEAALGITPQNDGQVIRLKKRDIVAKNRKLAYGLLVKKQWTK